MNVVDLMTTDVISVTTGTGLREAARLMFRNRVSGLPITDDSGALVGIITEADFLKLEVERQEGTRDQGDTVADVMSRGVVTVQPEVEIYEAAKIMAVQEVRRLPVIDEEGRLLGVISRADIVSIFTRPDDVIEDEIREDLLRRVLLIDPDGIRIGVVNGVVTLDGEVATRNEASMLEELTNRLDGVLRVESKLTWAEDD